MSTELPETFSFLLKMCPGVSVFESEVTETETETGATVATFFYDPHMEVDSDDIKSEMIYAYGHKVLGCEEAHTAHDLVDVELHDILPIEGYDHVYRAFGTITKK